MKKQSSRQFRKSSRAFVEAAVVVSTISLAACNSDKTLSGAVAASGYAPGSVTGDPTLTAGYYAGAKVFLDANSNGQLDSGEDSTTTDASGKFSLKVKKIGSGQLIADIGTSTTNTATAAAVASHLILRASAAQIADQGESKIVISPMSSEVQRLVEANGSSYATEKANLATRLSGPAFGQGNAAFTDALVDVNTLSGVTKYTALYEDNELTHRFTYATTKFDRGDLYPDNLAVKGGDPRLAHLSGVSTGTVVTPLETQAQISFAQSQQAAFNLEGVPAYDNIFIIMEENKSTDAIVGSAYAPYVNQLLGTYNQLTTYYSTGNPSEPNYLAIGGGDDNGITDDNWFGCGDAGGYAIQDTGFAAAVASDGQPLPAITALPPQDSAHLAGFSTTAGAACSTTPASGSGTVHNILSDSLFTLLSRAGMTARTYSESMNPGQDPRADSQSSTVAEAYSGTDINGTTVTDAQAYAIAAGLYKVKHGPSMGFQTARLLPEFVADNRTLFGTQYTAADWKTASQTAYPNYDSSNWIYDQFGKDLDAGDVGNINFVVPDQCDDMHGVGSDTESCNGGAVSNNGQNPSVTRADIYLKKVIDRIQASALWKNPQKRVAIVVMFDEGEGSSTACCGWNAGGKNSGDAVVTVNASGVATAITASTGYGNGNIGHGNSIFGIITNQQDVGTAKKGVVDSDAYSHFSLVRTMQDMFQLADPTVDASYLNRAKYTEAFIAANIMALPEFAASADTHFDSVRPINHAYVIPAGYVQKLNPADIQGVKDSGGNLVTGSNQITPRTGPDVGQNNVWALK